MGTVLTYEQLGKINARWFAILKQMHQRNGYPYNPEHLEKSLQMLFEGKFPADETDSLNQLPGKVAEPKWREENNVIYFSVTSDGATGKAWFKRLVGKGFRVEDYDKQFLLSDDFKPTSGVTTEVAVLKGVLFSDRKRITSYIRTRADKSKLSKPNPEIACLIREKFTDKDIERMGLWHIVVMHEPIEGFDGTPALLNANRDVHGQCFGASYGNPGIRWDRETGFAFAVSQVSSQG